MRKSRVTRFNRKFTDVTRGLDPIGAKIRGVSRAQRSASRRRGVRCRPGIVTHTTFAKVPDQRRTASLPLALHRIRDTR